MKRRKFKIPFKIIIIILLAAGMLYFSFRLLSNFLWTSDYFKIRTIAANDSSLDLSYLKGRNIFSVDLEKEARKILAMQPDYHKISLAKKLPDCIKAQLLKREPIAYLRLYKYFAVDDELVLFYPEQGKSRDSNLPVILGLQTKILGPKLGQSYAYLLELNVAAEAIIKFKATRGLGGYDLNRVDVSQLPELSLYIGKGVEIKLGQESIGRKLRILASALKELSDEFDKIKYIDLRFKKPTVKYK